MSVENSPGGKRVGEYSSGGMDPTENVKALAAAQALSQKEKDDLIARYNENESRWQVKYFEALAVAERMRIKDLTVAEKERVDGLAAQKSAYDKQISDTQTSQLKTTSDLVSTQLEKVTSSLSQTIDKTAQNISGMLAELSRRLIPLEEFRSTMGGKASVSDPAMNQIANELAQLKLTVTRTTGSAEGEIARSLDDFQRRSLTQSSNQNWIALAAAIIAAFVAAGALLGVVLSRQPEPPQRPVGAVVHRIGGQL